MDFSFTKEEEDFRMELRTWLEENLPEGWLEGKRELPKDKEAYSEFLRNWQKNSMMVIGQQLLGQKNTAAETQH